MIEYILVYLCHREYYPGVKKGQIKWADMEKLLIIENMMTFILFWFP